MKQKGFTLIEMLIVIAIMAILIGIALPRLRSMQSEGDYAEARGELRTLQAAVESYFIHHNRAYPVQIVTADTAWQGDANSLTTAVPQIIAGVLIDPFSPTGLEYQWVTNAASNSQYYVIFSVGPDGGADITAISGTGVITRTGGSGDDDIHVSNGTSPSGG